MQLFTIKTFQWSITINECSYSQSKCFDSQKLYGFETVIDHQNTSNSLLKCALYLIFQCFSYFKCLYTSNLPIFTP